MLVRITVLACAALCALASPAGAKTYRGMAAAGPAIAGDSVLWGTEYGDGSGAVKRDGRVIARFARMTGKGERRQFGGVPGAISASTSSVAYTVVESRDTGGGGDYGSSTSSAAPMLSAGGAPFANPLGCSGAYVSTAVEGDTVAIAVNGSAPCAGVYLNGRKVSEADDVRQVRLAGPYVAWEEWPGGAGVAITVADVATGAVLRRFTPPGNRRWDEFDIDERGNVVTTLGRLVTFSLSDPRPRTLAKRAWGTVAIAGGRVAYVSVGADSGPDRLLLLDLQGRVLRRLDRYGERRRPAGEIALTDRWIAWSVKRASYEAVRGPGNVFLKRL
jgi:hypothetical protein